MRSSMHDIRTAPSPTPPSASSLPGAVSGSGRAARRRPHRCRWGFGRRRTAPRPSSPCSCSASGLFGPRIVQWAIPAREIPHDDDGYMTHDPIGAIVARRCRDAGVPLVRLGVVDDGVPNAFDVRTHAAQRTRVGHPRTARTPRRARARRRGCARARACAQPRFRAHDDRRGRAVAAVRPRPSAARADADDGDDDEGDGLHSWASPCSSVISCASSSCCG